MEIKPCYYCVEKKAMVDYKMPESLQYYISNYKKILPPRYTGLCAKHQRKVATAVKLSREMAFMPYVRTK